MARHEAQTRRRAVPPLRRARRRAVWLFLLMLALLAVLVWLVCRPAPAAYEIREGRLMTPVVHVIGEDGAESPSDGTPDALPAEDGTDGAPDDSADCGEDELLLAKIMQKEEGSGWPDAMIMLLGEVVLNRVESPEFPDTVREVLYQVDGGYVQYAPVHEPGWEFFEPDEHHRDLARRLLSGERVLGEQQIVYQALFEQGRGTVLTYHDFTLGSDTYFCLTARPGLYG